MKHFRPVRITEKFCVRLYPFPYPVGLLYSILSTKTRHNIGSGETDNG
ncbi:MAG: hypothetical protein ACRDRF_00700 [Pseudonocardiaceae bacterium]